MAGPISYPICGFEGGTVAKLTDSVAVARHCEDRELAFTAGVSGVRLEKKKAGNQPDEKSPVVSFAI